MNLFIKILIYVTLYTGLFSLAFFLLSFLEKKKKNLKLFGKVNVSVIIPAYNEEKSLKRTVESVVNLSYPKDKLEIIIVNDGSKDNTEKIGKNLAIQYRNVKYYSKKNGGKASALNYGIEKAKGELIATLDADSMVNSDALNKMIPYFADAKTIAVTPAMKVYNPKGIIQRIQAIEYDLGIFLRKSLANVEGINVAPGPFSVFRKNFFLIHGGYDENSITEDMEMAMRIQSLNYKIANSASALVYTIAPNKFKDLLKQRRRWYYGTIETFLKYRKVFSVKYGEFGFIALPLAIFSVISTMIISSYYLFRVVMDSINQINLYSAIGYDFLNNFSFKSYIVVLKIYEYFSNGLGFFALIFTIFSLVLLIFLNKFVKSRQSSISTFISYGLFLVVYSTLYAFWWLVAMTYYLFNRRIKW